MAAHLELPRRVASSAGTLSSWMRAVRWWRSCMPAVSVQRLRGSGKSFNKHKVRSQVLLAHVSQSLCSVGPTTPAAVPLCLSDRDLVALLPW